MDYDKGQALRGGIQFEVDDPRHGGLNGLKWPALDGENEEERRRIKRRLGTEGWLLKPIKLFPRDRIVGESLLECENTKLGTARTLSVLRKNFSLISHLNAYLSDTELFFLFCH